MKKIFFALFTLFSYNLAICQVQQGFNYQAVIRNINGQIITNQNIKFRISLEQDSIGGQVVYSENHDSKTNQFGMANLIIGKGKVLSGDFNSISWAAGPYFLKTEMDPTGGTNYQLIGSSQLLQVPYAKFAETSGNAALPQYTQTQINALIAFAGLLVFNTDYKIFQMYNGKQWVAIQTTKCTPMPGTADAGPDQTWLPNTSVSLTGNVPGNGIIGKWDIINGTGGSFSDNTKYNTTFSGSNNIIYTLRWSLMSPCDTTYDDVIISFGLPEINFNGIMYVCGNDNSAGIKWDIEAINVTNGNSAQSTTDGEANTSAIVMQRSSNARVAYLCDTLNAYGFNDWYLPAKDELHAIYVNKTAIGGLNQGFYWSSTQNDTQTAWSEYFVNGVQTTALKTTVDRIRCVRR